MPDSAVKATSRPIKPRSSDTDLSASQAIASGAEAENKLARAARSAQRLAHLSRMPSGTATPDLFA
jgi:hypothetical protein